MELDRRNAQALLKDVGGIGRQAAGRLAADVLMMRDARRIGDHRAAA
jgi:hypothetical protein